MFVYVLRHDIGDAGELVEVFEQLPSAKRRAEFLAKDEGGKDLAWNRDGDVWSLSTHFHGITTIVEKAKVQ